MKLRAYRILRQVDVARVIVRNLRDILRLRGAQSNTCSIDGRLTDTDVSKVEARERRENTDIGSTLPSPPVPRPWPSFQPIIFNSLFPTLFSSFPGLSGGGGGEGGGGGPSDLRFAGADTSPGMGRGMSG